jgi:hypothetical protein
MSALHIPSSTGPDICGAKRSFVRMYEGMVNVAVTASGKELRAACCYELYAHMAYGMWWHVVASCVIYHISHST